MRVDHMAGSFKGKSVRFRLSSASERALSATMTPSSRAATSDCALTTSRGAMVPTLTRISFSSRSFLARSRLFCAAARLSME
jgi:hypothetical protein